MGTNDFIAERDFDCPLCMELLFEPITLHCGHTICRTCIIQSLALKKHCPICRTFTDIDPHTHSSTHIISQIAQKISPEKYELSKNVANESREKLKESLGLFKSEGILLPEQTIVLSIFKPKYRIMINRAINSSKRFAFLYKSLSKRTTENSNSSMMRKTVCIARIEQYATTSSGSLNIKIQGVSAAQIIDVHRESGSFGMKTVSVMHKRPLKTEIDDQEKEMLYLTFRSRIYALFNTSRLPSAVSNVPENIEKMPFWVFREFLPSLRILNCTEVNDLAYKCLSSVSLLEICRLSLKAMDVSEKKMQQKGKINGLICLAIFVVALVYIFCH